MRILLGLVCLVVLGGCDPIYGVSRNAQVAFLPDAAKVQALVRAVPGVQEVHYKEARDGSRPLTLGGVQPPDIVLTLFYSGSNGVHGVLQFSEDYQHHVEYSQTLLQMGGRPPQQEIDATLPVMKEIELRLETRLGFTALRDSVVQHYSGVRNQ